MYTAWYGIGRAWMEALRSTEYNLHIFGIRVNMLLAILLAVVAIGLLIYIRVRKPERLMRNVESSEEEKEVVYERQFDYASEREEELKEEETDGENN